MKISVPKGTVFIALDENRKLISEGEWNDPYSIIDFSGRYINPAGRDVYNNLVFGSRGFRYSDKGVTWDFI